MGEGLEYTFWCLAIGGTLIFVFKLVMLFMGMDGGEDGDIDMDVGDADIDVEADFDDAAHDAGFGHDEADSTRAFNLLSLQSIACLAMGTGWMGIAVMRNFDGVSNALAIAIGLAFGLALVYLMGKLLQMARKLESSGTLDVRNAVGRSGTVYARIPEGGSGQVQIVIQGRLATVSARAAEGTVDTGTKVRVASVDNDGTLVVAPQ